MAAAWQLSEAARAPVWDRLLAYHQVRLWETTGDRAALERWLALAAPTQPAPCAPLWALHDLAVARAALALGRPERVIATLQRTEQETHASGATGWHLEALLGPSKGNRSPRLCRQVRDS